jgi:hypothetical protein
MSVIARPGVLASVLAATAVALHPALRASRLVPGHEAVVAALLLLCALGLAARAASSRRADAGVAAVGAAVLVGALAADGVLGHHGALSLAPGRTQANFEEASPGGRSLGLRPLGFPVGVERVSDGPGGPRVALALPGTGAGVEVTPGRSAAFGGYRFARPAVTSTGGVARPRVSASDGTRAEAVDLAPGVPGRVFGRAVALEEYFPDFALDESRRPFTRSAEPRNPAALLVVEQGGQAHRVFVLRSMPGIHRVEDLGLAFSLLEVEAERAIALAVHRQPAAAGVLTGALLLGLGAALSLRTRRARFEGDRDAPPALAGAALVALLLLAGGGSLLSWTLAVRAGDGPLPIPGAGVVLGAALVAALGGTLLLAAGRLAGDAAGVRPAGRGALWAGAAATAVALAIAAVRLASHPAASAALLPLGALALVAAWLAGSLLATRAEAPSLFAGAAPLVRPVAAFASVAAGIAVGVSAVLRDGTYATPSVAASACAVLLGLAALEPTRAPGLRLLAFALALLAPAVA